MEYCFGFVHVDAAADAAVVVVHAAVLVVVAVAEYEDDLVDCYYYNVW
jgi:hypothetical protein